MFLPKSNAIINSFLTLMISLHMSSQQQQREEWLERVESRRLRSAPGLSGNSNICTSHAQNRNGWIDRFNDISLHRNGMRNNSYLEDDDNDVSSLDMRSAAEVRSKTSDSDTFYDPVFDLKQSIERFSSASQISKIIGNRFSGPTGFESHFGMPVLHYLILELDAEPSHMMKLLHSVQSSVLDPKALNQEGNSALTCLWNNYIQDFGHDLRRATLVESRKIYGFTNVLMRYETRVSLQVIESYMDDAWEKFSNGRHEI